MRMLILATVALSIWVFSGLLAWWWLARHGHRSRWWLLMAILMGPVLAATAPERAERTTHAVEEWEPTHEPGDRPRVLVGVDGSAESDEALRAALSILPEGTGTVLLASVVDYDAEHEAGDATAVPRAHQRLDDVSADLTGRHVVCEVLAGPPADALLQCADDHDADMIVVGKRGSGMSTRLLGSVSRAVLRRSRRPVLVGTPMAVDITHESAGARTRER